MEQAERAFLEPAVLSRLANLPLAARKPMLGSVAGRHRSPYRGSSVEFAEYCKYIPGDDPRQLDWRAYGRTDRFYVKQFEADTNLRLIPVIDASGSMRYPTGGGVSKLTYAKKVVATLAYLASQQGDAVGLVCAAASLGRQIPPRRNPAHLRGVFDCLGELQAGGETGLIAALHAVAEQTPQRALIVIVSDLFVPPDELARCFQHLRFRKHDVAVFHLLEHAELEFDFDRPTRFLDLEGGATLLVEPSAIRREYDAALGDYLTRLDEAVREAAVDYHRVRVSEPHGDVLARFLLGRAPRRARR